MDEHITQVLKLLTTNKNVILLGPPGSGKSTLMSYIAERFIGINTPSLEPSSSVPIPKSGAVQVEDWLPSPEIKSNREIFKITFHQGTKNRDFVGGITPRLKEGEQGFTITDGILHRANNNAIDNKGASLLIIDEINRGPAVSIFGDTLNSIEIDKRLDENNQVSMLSSPFKSITPDGTLNDFYLSPHIYILTSMNEADTSVEPLDVAFLRRFATYRLDPDVSQLYDFFQISESQESPEIASDIPDVLSALICAWQSVNNKISIGKGDHFQLGHGVLMSTNNFTDLHGSLVHALSCWKKIEMHVKEIFFGNDVAQSVIFNSDINKYYPLTEKPFGDRIITKIHYAKYDLDSIYELLKSVCDDERK